MGVAKTEKIPGLTPKRRRFVAEYLKDYNGTQAAIRAGYSPTSANQQASAILAIPNVKALVEQKEQSVHERLGLDAAWVLSRYMNIADADLAEAYHDDGRLKQMHEIPIHLRKALGGVEVEKRTEGRGDDAEEVMTTKIKLVDRKGALDSLARNMKLLDPETSVNVTVTYADLLKDEKPNG